ncbi:MAG: GNAT family N-acetyltransferase [Roseovarius sp.]|nr:GNAT family N-acetyltransferase [Roseovarius sp.]
MIAPQDMARIHAAAFDGQGRAWRADEFADLIATDQVLCAGDMHGFALARLIVDEAELLTLATHPTHRRQGRARRLLATLEADLLARGAVRLFLEVAEDNAPARALYHAAAYVETARRAKYYARPSGGRVDALILSKPLE